MTARRPDCANCLTNSECRFESTSVAVGATVLRMLAYRARSACSSRSAAAAFPCDAVCTLVRLADVPHGVPGSSPFTVAARTVAANGTDVAADDDDDDAAAAWSSMAHLQRETRQRAHTVHERTACARCHTHHAPCSTACLPARCTPCVRSFTAPVNFRPWMSASRLSPACTHTTRAYGPAVHGE